MWETEKFENTLKTVSKKHSMDFRVGIGLGRAFP
jgi:GTP cyclohydrolase III